MRPPRQAISAIPIRSAQARPRRARSVHSPQRSVGDGLDRRGLGIGSELQPGIEAGTRSGGRPRKYPDASATARIHFRHELAAVPAATCDLLNE
jgi:hypothetical protein